MVRKIGTLLLYVLILGIMFYVVATRLGGGCAQLLP